MQAKDCEALKAEVKAIEEWKLSLSEPAKTVEVDCDNKSLNRVEITEILPNYFKELSGKKAVCYGPN